MSTHYLVDTHVTPFSAAGNPRILDVIEASGGTSPMVGGLTIRVPDYVPIQPPTTVFTPGTGLLARKYQGLLAYYAGFPYITYDDLTDLSGVNFASSTRGYFGNRGEVSIAPGGSFVSTVVTLSGTAPSQAIVTWEAYTVTTAPLENQRDLRTARTYTEVPASTLDCVTSFNEGDPSVEYYGATDGNVLNIPAIGQGTSFSIRLSNPSSSRVWLGGWAVIY